MFAMRSTNDRDETTVEFGGRGQGNAGKVVKVRFVGSERFGVVVVTRLSKDARTFRTHSWSRSKVGHRMQAFVDAQFNREH